VTLLLIYSDRSVKWSDDTPTVADLLAVQQGLLTIVKIISLRNLQILTKSLKWEEVPYSELNYIFNKGFTHL
jgi:hypothetical protein